MVIFSDVKDRNKVLLFFPKLDPRESSAAKTWQPLSSLILAENLMHKGFSVEIYDSRTQDDFEDTLAKNKDDLLFVGVSAMAGYQIIDGYNFSKYVKEHFPHIPVLWGGWFPSLIPDQCLESPYIDIVIKGQGEVLLPKIATKIKTVTPIDDMTGISFKQNGKVIHNSILPLEDMNNFLPVNYKLLEESRYTISEGLLHYISSIGCPYACTFCGVSAYLKRKWYGLNPERVVSEIKGLCEKYQLKEIIFFDSTFFVNLERAKEILKGFIRENLKFRWLANSYVNQVVNFDDEMLELLQATNCYCIELGIESGSTKIRELFQKNFSDDNISKALEKLNNVGVSVRGNYIIAPPTEKKEDFLATVRSMTRVKKAHANNIVMMYQYTPIPGTQLDKYEKEEKRMLLPKSIADWSNYYMQLSKNLAAPWLAKKDELGRQPILLYFKLAFMQPWKRGKLIAFPLSVIQKLAAFRLYHEIFTLPIEWYFFRVLRCLYGKLF